MQSNKEYLDSIKDQFNKEIITGYHHLTTDDISWLIEQTEKLEKIQCFVDDIYNKAQLDSHGEVYYEIEDAFNMMYELITNNS